MDDVPLICDPVPGRPLFVWRKHTIVDGEVTLVDEIQVGRPGERVEWPDAEFCAA